MTHLTHFLDSLLLPSFHFRQEVLKAVEYKNFGKLKLQDQLRKEKEKGNVLLGFGMFFDGVMKQFFPKSVSRNINPFNQ